MCELQIKFNNLMDKVCLLTKDEKDRSEVEELAKEYACATIRKHGVSLRKKMKEDKYNV